MNPVAETGAALILDADNISDSAAIDRAVATLKERGLRLTVRRAYGGHDKLAGLKECLARHGFRALVNHGKGTTDAMLVVDVMDLFHAGTIPSVVALASSDGDFAPLAVRLREAGRWTICFAQVNKAAVDDLEKAYDEVIFVDAPTARAPAARAAARAPAARAPAPAAAKAPRKAAARKKSPPPAPPADPVRELLSQIPGFDAGRTIELNEAVKRLRDAKLMTRSATSPKFFARHPFVELIPARQPNKLRLRES